MSQESQVENVHTDNDNISSLIPMADTYFESGMNVLLIGKHGVGKTVDIQRFVARRGLKWKYFSCSTLDPYTDLVGIPTPRDWCAHCKRFWREERNCPDCGKPTVESLQFIRPREVDEANIIFFDELNRAEQKTQNAVFEIIQFRTINGEPLPNLQACWGAINPHNDEQNYQVEVLDPALLDRFDVYVHIQPRPSVPYMRRHMPSLIAKELVNWWNEHQSLIDSGAKDPIAHYISPRRLEKIGLVWCATKNLRAVYSAFPEGEGFAKQKLVDALTKAQQRVDQGEEAPEEVVAADEESNPSFDGVGLGDSPSDEFLYTEEGLALETDRLAEYLERYPDHLPTHKKVAETLMSGVGGAKLIKRHYKALNAMHAATLEGLFAQYPDPKVNLAKAEFVRLIQEEGLQAKTVKRLHNILHRFGGKVENFPNP